MPTISTVFLRNFWLAATILSFYWCDRMWDKTYSSGRPVRWSTQEIFPNRNLMHAWLPRRIMINFICSSKISLTKRWPRLMGNGHNDTQIRKSASPQVRSRKWYFHLKNAGSRGYFLELQKIWINFRFKNQMSVKVEFYDKLGCVPQHSIENISA